jgi:hypothetical protein
MLPQKYLGVVGLDFGLKMACAGLDVVEKQALVEMLPNTIYGVRTAHNTLPVV